MKNKLIPFIVSAIMLGACEQNEKKETNIKNKVNDEVNQVAGKSASEFDNKLNELLTLDIAATVMGYSSSESETDYQKVLKSTVTHSVAYLWDKGRIEKIKSPIGKSTIDVPTKDIIELSWVKNTSLSEFKNNYHTPTDEEIANAEKAMNNKMKEMQDKGKIDNFQTNSAKDLATNLGKNLSYDEVPNVGEYSVWNNKTKQLVVYYKGLQFIITVNIGNETENKKISILAAQEIIKQKL